MRKGPKKALLTSQSSLFCCLSVVPKLLWLVFWAFLPLFLCPLLIWIFLSPLSLVHILLNFHYIPSVFSLMRDPFSSYHSPLQLTLTERGQNHHPQSSCYCLLSPPSFPWVPPGIWGILYGDSFNATPSPPLLPSCTDTDNMQVLWLSVFLPPTCILAWIETI